MPFFRFTALTCCLAVLPYQTVSAQQSAPQGFLYGVGIGVNQEIYQGYRQRVIPLPVLGYRGDKLSVYGPFISYKLADLGNFTISAKLAPRFAGFDSSDSDIFTGMAKRKNAIDAGIAVQLRQQQWLLEAETLYDVLGHSKGNETKLNISYQVRQGPVVIEPKFGISYADSRLVDYYYGVRIDEATSTRAAYEASGTVNYNAGVAISTPVLFGGMTRLGIEHHWYGSSIGNSPLTDRDSGLSAFLTWSRMF